MPRVPTPQRLRSVATLLEDAYRDLWQQRFPEAVHGVVPAALREALRSRRPRVVEDLVMATWADQVETPVRQGLARLMDDTVGAVMTSADLPQPTRRLLREPTVQARIAAQVGTEITSVSRTTQRTVQEVLRAGWQAGESPETLALRLRSVIGLTPRQAQHLATLRADWRAAGYPARTITQLARQAQARALQARALLIARTESITAANLGAYATLQALAQQGSLVSASTLRRYWVTTGNACPTCAAVPGMNPNGVPWDQPFQTPDGPAYYPALHPGCACVTRAMYATEG